MRLRGEREGMVVREVVMVGREDSLVIEVAIDMVVVTVGDTRVEVGMVVEEVVVVMEVA